MPQGDNAGRPTKMTPETLKKLDYAFSRCYSDKEACLYAGISHETLYSYQRKFPKYAERKEQLRLTPNLAAKDKLVSEIPNSLPQAQWWATNKMSDEFAPKSKIEQSGKIQTEEVGTANAEALEALGDKFNAELRSIFAKKKNI